MKKTKILVFSDSHGREKNIETAIEVNGGRADAFVFLGDGVLGANSVFEKYPNVPHVCVKGNCDPLFVNEVDETVIELGGIRILCMHGHKYDVKSTLLWAGYRAKEQNCQMLLFGHTHSKLELRRDDLIYFNPGTIGRGYPDCTYGVIEIVGNQIVCSHGKV